jgi:hypothetical protein
MSENWVGQPPSDVSTSAPRRANNKPEDADRWSGGSDLPWRSALLDAVAATLDRIVRFPGAAPRSRRSRLNRLWIWRGRHD